jgi:hypothetical protein
LTAISSSQLACAASPAARPVSPTGDRGGCREPPSTSGHTGPRGRCRTTLPRDSGRNAARADRSPRSSRAHVALSQPSAQVNERPTALAKANQTPGGARAPPPRRASVGRSRPRAVACRERGSQAVDLQAVAYRAV